MATIHHEVQWNCEVEVRTKGDRPFSLPLLVFAGQSSKVGEVENL